MTSLSDAQALVTQIVDNMILRAGSFIVTIYGDVVEPRGGRVWIGNIIETCSSVGISETLVRTAVSRLVSAQQLVGERGGRRSYYRLTPAAQREFLQAARILFEPEESRGWSFVWLSPTQSEGVSGKLEAAGFAKLSGQWLVGPSARLPSESAAVVFEAAGAAASEALREFAAAHWDLGAHEAAYSRFLALFSPVEHLLSDGLRVSPDQSLQLRLLLVHQFRHVALRDPGLPREALPTNWIGHRARELFVRLYIALSPLADSHVASRFVAEEGPLSPETPATARRAARLEHSLRG
nr:PaaX family transcriptional regulator C-terminal domain-containing protein [Microvirga terricola]